MTLIKFNVPVYSVSQLAFLIEISRVVCEVRNEPL